MGREGGGGIGMGKTCEPKAFSFQCMTEFTTNKKKLKKIKKKRNKAARFKIYRKKKKKKNTPSNAGDMGSIPGQETKILHAIGQLIP